MITFTEEILNEKLYFLCSDRYYIRVDITYEKLSPKLS